MSKHNIRLTWFLGLGGALMLIMFLGLGLMTYRGNIVRSESANAAVLSALIADDVEQTIYGVSQLLSGLEALVKTESYGSQNHSVFIRETLMRLMDENPHLMDLLVLDRDLRITHWTGTGAPPEVRDRDYARAHTTGSAPEIFIGKPKLSRVHEGAWFFGISTTVRDEDGEIAWVLVAIIDVVFFRDLLDKTKLSERFVVDVTSPQGIIYVIAPSKKDWTGRKLPGFTGDRPESGEVQIEIRASDFSQGDRLYAQRRVGGYGLFTTVSISEEAMFDEWEFISTVAVAVALTLGATILFMTFRLAEGQASQGRMAREMERLATIDPLTQIYNRRHFETLANEEIDRSRRYGGFFSCVMLDLDKFKNVNDIYGHEAGDKVLHNVAKVLSDTCRASDIISRYGGEEFLILLPEVDLDGALRMAEKARVEIEGAVINVMGEGLKITASFGVAQWKPDSDTELTAVLRRADEALYNAKKNGRNKVCAG